MDYDRDNFLMNEKYNLFSEHFQNIQNVENLEDRRVRMWVWLRSDNYATYLVIKTFREEEKKNPESNRILFAPQSQWEITFIAPLSRGKITERVLKET